MLEAKGAGGGGGRRVHGGRRCHAALHHQRQFGHQRAVRVQWRAGVGPGGDRHAVAQRHAKPFEVTIGHGERLAHRVLGNAARHAAGRDGGRRDQRRHQRHAVARHPLAQRLGEEHAVLDRGDPALETVRDTVAAHGVRGRPAAGLARLLDAGHDLVARELGGVRLHPGRHHAAGGEELDDVGAGLELLAHGLAHVVGAIGLAADQVPAVAAGHADTAPGAQDPRARDEAVADGVPHAQLGVVAAAEVAHGRHAGLQRLPRPQHRLDHGHRVRVALHRRGRIGLAAEAQVHVHVDQPGQQRQPVQPQGRAGRRVARRHDGADAALLDDHRAPRHRWRTAAVEQQGAGQDGALHGER